MRKWLWTFAVAFGVCGSQGLAEASSVAVGSSHVLLVQSDGTVLAWGENYSGQVGDGTTDSPKSPTAVSFLTGITHVAAGRRPHRSA